MGMAASQARYLELTARQTNVEYQGQQINQQRMQLSNESAGLFSQLMDLNVPTAPSSSDYTQTSYSFSDGNNVCNITGIDKKSSDPNYNATVTYYYTEAIDKGVGYTRSDLGVSNVSGVYWLTNGSDKSNKAKLTQCQESDTNIDDEKAALLQICMDNPTSKLASDLGYNPTTKTIANVTSAYQYKNTNGATYYYSVSDLVAASAKEGAATSLTGYYESSIEQKVYNKTDAYLLSTDTGRYSSITLKDYTSAFDLTATTTTDANAYNDAVNEYEYKQALYQQEVAKINAKTSVVQNEDKVLELQLKQLDTEQQALQTEMDSVKKVIDKNIEQTFKTFQ